MHKNETKNEKRTKIFFFPRQGGKSESSLRRQQQKKASDLKVGHEAAAMASNERKAKQKIGTNFLEVPGGLQNYSWDLLLFLSKAEKFIPTHALEIFFYSTKSTQYIFIQEFRPNSIWLHLDSLFQKIKRTK